MRGVGEVGDGGTTGGSADGTTAEEDVVGERERAAVGALLSAPLAGPTIVWSDAERGAEDAGAATDVGLEEVEAAPKLEDAVAKGSGAEL